MSKRLLALMVVAALLMTAGWPGPSTAAVDDLPLFEFVARMKESLKLTDVQVAALQPVITTRIDRVDAGLAALDGAEAPDITGFIQAYGEIRKEFEAGLMKVLTLDQRKPWESSKADVEKDLVGAGASRQATGLKSALKLSDEQTTRLQSAMTNTIQQKFDLLQKLSESGYIDVREKHRAQRTLDELNAELEKSISTILTLDQRNAYKKLKGKSK